MEHWLLQIDYNLLEKVNGQWTASWADAFFPFITDLHKSSYFFVLLIPLLLFLFYRKYKKTGFIYFFFLIFSLLFSDWAGAKVKNHYHRLRPFENQEIHVVQKSPAGSKSFYSNHTSNMFTFATFSTYFFPQLAIPFYTMASLVAYSRIYNGVHYPSDVFAGALMGIIWGLAFSSFAKRFKEKVR